jgi:hypothetical protein
MSIGAGIVLVRRSPSRRRVRLGRRRGLSLEVK